MHFYSRQLTLVRERLGLSQKSVAARLGISPSLVSKWEKGERTPDDSQFWELGRLYGVTASFLQKQRSPIHFQPRTQIPRTSTEKAALGAALNDAAQQIEFLFEALELGGRTPRRLALSLEYADSMLCSLAATVRSYLRLNDRVTYAELRDALAENHVLVFEWKLPPRLSGLSYQRDCSVIFINSQMPERVKLFTLCHELAHLLFHLRGENHAEVSLIASRNDPLEREANHFAAELLMPSMKVSSIVQSQGSLLLETPGFCAAAEEFGVSYGAWFYRLAQAPWSVVKYSQKSQLFTQQSRPEVEVPGARVSSVKEQIAPAFLKLVLEQWLAGKVSSGRFSEWCFAARSKMDAYLMSLPQPDVPLDDWDLGYAEVDNLVG